MAPFYRCSSLTSINVDENNTNFCSYKDALYNKAQTMLYQIPCKWRYGDVYEDEYDDIFIAVYPETLQRVLQYAAIGSSIKGLYLPYNVNTIDAYAFGSCKGLKTVHLPSSVKTVHAYAFADCDAINRVELNLETPPAIDYFPAVTDKSNVDLYMPYGSYDAYANSSIWSQYNQKTENYDHIYCWDIVSGRLRYSVISTSPYGYDGVFVDGTLRVVKFSRISYYSSLSIPSILSYAGKSYVPDEIGAYAAFDQSNNFVITLAPSIRLIREHAFEHSKLTTFPFTNVVSIRSYAFYFADNLNAQLTDLQALQTIGDYAFYGSGITKFVAPTTLTSIGVKAFFYCPMLHEIFLPHIDGKQSLSCGTLFIGENANDFKCWVDYRRLADFKNMPLGNASSTIYPHLFLDSEWQSFACVKDINFQGVSDLDAYTVSDYNQSTKKATLSEVANLAANNGAVVHGNVGTYYRLDYATSGSTSSWMEGVTGSSQTVNSNSTTSYYKLNATKPQFDKITNNTTFNRGYAYLKVPTSQTGGVSTIYTNLSEGSETILGDVNGDGKVNVSDVSTLINMILGLSPMDEALADVNGDGKVNVSDVTALINIILGIS